MRCLLFVSAGKPERTLAKISQKIAVKCQDGVVGQFWTDTDGELQRMLKWTKKLYRDFDEEKEQGGLPDLDKYLEGRARHLVNYSDGAQMYRIPYYFIPS